MTEQERNVGVIEAYHEAFNRGDLSATVAAFSDPTTNHGRSVPRARIRLVLEDIRTRFPGAKLQIEKIVAVNDQVIVRNTYSGTHLGVGSIPVDGGLLVGVPPTGKRFAVQVIHWFTLDDVGMMVQLGLITPPRPAAT
jgi:predicted ester cyclase